MHKYFLLIMILILSSTLEKFVYANDLPMPRFASIKSAKMNSRTGPGFDYPVIWHYWRKNMPVEIIEEYDQWRKIKDIDNDVSWVYQSLLSGNRSAIIKEGDDDDIRFLPILTSPTKNSHVISQAEQGAIVKIKKCDGDWCYVNVGKVAGYMKENKLWGLYDKEILK